MFAIQCQFCRHENAPGTKFCGDCGSPLHLKPCPNCGKVDDVGASACYACGTEFPPIATAQVGAAQTDAAAPAGRTQPAIAVAADAAPVRKAQKPRSPAWPLVLVAVLAGGLPLIWMNRANLPLPQAWRPGDGSEVSRQGAPTTPTLPIRMPPPAGSAAPPLDAPKPAEAAVPLPAPLPTPPTPAAPTIAPVVEPAPPVASEPVASPKAKPEPAARKAQAAQTAQRAKSAPAPAREEKPKAVDESQEKKPAPAARPAVQECTEALAALGLCDMKKNGK
jgi:hypothetical protein